MARVPRFDPTALSNAANDAFTVRRVFGEAYEHDGVTVIPVAKLWAATGMGAGDGEGDVSLPAPGSAPADWVRTARAAWARATGDESWDADAAPPEPQPEPHPIDAGQDEADEVGEDGDAGDARGANGGYGGGHGGGGGYGVRVKPVGAYVVDADGVHWRPALDLNRVILGGQLVGATAVASIGLVLAVKAVTKALSTSVTAIANR